MGTSLTVLLWIAGAGAFGGFVDGLITSKPYRLRIASHSLDLGFIGDAFYGATAGVAIFAFAGAVFKFELGKFGDTQEFLRIIAWGMLSGFAGLRLLQPLSERMIRQIARDTVTDAVGDVAAKDLEVSMAIDRGRCDLANFDLLAQHLGWLQGTDDQKKKLQDLLDDAGRRFDLVLKTAPNHEEAKNGKARTAKRRAQLTLDMKDKKAKLQQAVDLESEIITSNPKSSRAYYNRACYKTLLGMPDDIALADLRTAIDINPAWKSNAQEDDDFKSLWTKDEFKHLIGAH